MTTRGSRTFHRSRAARFAAALFALCAALAAPSWERARAQQQQPTETTPQQPTPAPSPQPANTPTPTPPPQPPPARAGEDDGDVVERVDASATNVLMTAVDKNRRFVTTLRREDVRLLENGVPQELSVFQHQTDLPLSLVILIDTSSSQEKVLPEEQAAATAFVNSVLRPGKDRAAVLSFTSLVKKEQDLTGDLSLLRSAISRVKVLYNYDQCNPDDEERLPEEEYLFCYTGVWHALAVAVEQVLARTPENTRRAIVLLSDGDDTIRDSARVGYMPRDEAVELAVRHNTAVYSVGIRDRDFPGGGGLRKGLLEKLSEQTGGRAFFPRDPSELPSAFALIEQELRSQYFISYTPAPGGATADPFRRIKIEITNPELRKQKLRLLYREGYYARQVGGRQ